MSACLLLGVMYGFTAALQPGPFLSYLTAQTVRNGWRRSFPLVFTPLLSDGPVIGLVITVLSGVPHWWVQVLRFAGGGFMVWLAVGTLRSWKDFGIPERSGAPLFQRGIFRAAAINMLNPAPYLFWGLVTGPLLLKAWHEDPLNGIALLAGFYLTMTASLCGFILLLSFAGKLGSNVNRALLGLSGVVLAVLGVYQILKGLTGLSAVLP
ncbi:MAG: LysE family transporter [Chlorobiaceae bacterium]|nr:LysE family transporter [Chlorobiaceae bacterium]